jgi:uncharacterized protein
MELNREKFGVTLSFNNKPERLVVPLEAITIFADPSVNFALQFQPIEARDMPDGGDDTPPKGTKKKPAADKTESKPAAESGEVISLDQFRKK